VLKRVLFIYVWITYLYSSFSGKDSLNTIYLSLAGLPILALVLTTLDQCFVLFENSRLMLALIVVIILLEEATTYLQFDATQLV